MSRSTGTSRTGLFGHEPIVINTFYSAWDFVVVNNRVYLNPSTQPAKYEPIVAQVQADGRVSAFAPSEADPINSGLVGRAHFAARGKEVWAALSYSRRLLAISPEGQLLLSTTLPFLAAKELERLGRDTSKTHPRPNIFRLPTFWSGAAAANGRLFLLADLPSFSVYEISPGGKIIDLFRDPEAKYGRHYEQLVVEIGKEARFFCIATEASGTKSVIEYIQ